jgi:hypothetical protein
VRGHSAAVVADEDPDALGVLGQPYVKTRFYGRGVSLAIRMQDNIAHRFRDGQLDCRHVDGGTLQRRADCMACPSTAHRLSRQTEVEQTLGFDPTHPAIGATRSATALRAVSRSGPPGFAQWLDATGARESTPASGAAARLRAGRLRAARAGPPPSGRLPPRVLGGVASWGAGNPPATLRRIRGRRERPRSLPTAMRWTHPARKVARLVVGSRRPLPHRRRAAWATPRSRARSARDGSSRPID